jgi:hypothetical protein
MCHRDGHPGLDPELGFVTEALLLLLLLESDGVARGREMIALSEGEGVHPTKWWRKTGPSGLTKIGRPGRVLPWPNCARPSLFFLLHDLTLKMIG